MSTYLTTQELDAARAKYRGEVIPAGALSVIDAVAPDFMLPNAQGRCWRFYLENMKTKKSIHIHSIPRLLLMVSVICSMAFVACSDVAGTAGTHPTVNLQSAAVGEPQTDDNVTIEAGKSPYDMLEDQLLESH
jgi:hypothetical protein